MECNDTISRHFKKIEGKNEDVKQQIKGVDFIYLINLDKRSERLLRCMQQLAPYSIQPHRVPGINGWNLSQETFNDIAMLVEPSMQYDRNVQVSFVLGGSPGVPFDDRLHGKRCLHKEAPAGGMGGCLAHLSILNDAYLSGYETVWILEDDFTVKGDPHELSDLIQQLNQEDNWDVLYTDDDCFYTFFNLRANCGSDRWLRPGMLMTSSLIERKAVGRNFIKIGGRTQAHSYLVSRSGMKKILDFVKRNCLFFPFDTELPCIEGIKLYNLRYDLIHGRDRSGSDTYCKRP